jgi:hypothetical protein
MAETPSVPLTPAEQRKRALIDAGAALVITMLIWPFPAARAMLSPVVNVLLVLLTWALVSIAYHVLCARVWRRTAALYLLGFALADRSGPAERIMAIENRAAVRWGIFAGALAVATTLWAGGASLAATLSGVELRRLR